MGIMTGGVSKSMSIMTRDMIKTMLAMIETMEIMTMKVVSSHMIEAMMCCIVANSVNSMKAMVKTVVVKVEVVAI